MSWVLIQILSPPSLRLIVAALSLAILALDLLSPWPTLVTVLYAVIVVFALALPNWEEVAAFAVMATIFILTGWTLQQPARGFEDLAARSLVLVAVWMTAAFAAWRQTHLALHLSEKRLEDAMEVGRCFAFEWTPATDLVVRSGNFRSVLGIDSSEPQAGSGAEFFRRVHPDDAPAMFTLLQSLTPERPDFQVTFRYVRGDGAIVRLEEQGRAIFNGGGKLVKLLGMSADVTQREAAAEALRDSEEQLRLALDAAEMGMFDVDAQTRSLRWSDRQCELLGARREQLRGDCSDFFDRVHPHDRNWLEEQLNTAFVQGKDVRSEFRIVLSDGSIGWLAGFGRPVFNEAGRVARMVGVNFDITQRKQAEQALRENVALFQQIAEHVDQVYYMISVPQARIVYMSPAYERLWGWPRPADLDIDEFRKLIHPDDLARVNAATIGRFFGEVDREGIEFRLVRPDGAIRWVRDMAFPIYDQHGSIDLVVGVTQDITPLKETEERMRTLEAELAHAGRLSTLNAMSAGLAHELNQPLAAIENYAASCRWMLEEQADREQALDILREISRQTQRAGEIVRRVRDFVVRGKSHRAPVQLNDLVREVAKLANPEIVLRGVALRLDLAADLPEVVCDRIQIAQVTLNLLRNAIEAVQLCPADERAVLVSTAQGQQDLVVCVQDSGHGLAAADRAQLFEPFFTTKPGGMGLGLVICQTIIRSHGGTIGMEPHDDRGTIFRFTLPLSDRRSDA